MFYVVTLIDRQLGYTLRGMARTVLSPTKDPSISSQTLLHTKNEVYILKILKIYNYDSEVNVPADTARRDYMEFVVEKGICSEALHEYLRENKMKHFIPKNLEASV